MTRDIARLQRLPAYAVADLATIKRQMVAEGRDVIDLSVGDADVPPPQVAVEALREALNDSRMSRYGFQLGLPTFREAVARYMARRFGVTVDPFTEVLPLLGSKDGLAHLPFAVLNRGDVCVLPEPGYPAYIGGAVLADADIELCRLEPEADFLVELEALPDTRLAQARLVYLNYPNNPTTAVAPLDYLERTVACCRERDIVIAYDNPYCEITFDGYRAPSIMELPGAREIALEFHSFSKSFGMTGWRLGWAVGSARLIRALSRVKEYMDTGPFLAVQSAGARVLDAADDLIVEFRRRFMERRDACVVALGEAGLPVRPPRATMYVWVPVPGRRPAREFAMAVLEGEAVVVVPGSAFGPGGEGFFRIALSAEPDRLSEAGNRMARICERLGVAGAHS